MSSKRLILQVNTSDSGGGAQRVSEDLHQEYRALGHDAWLAVGFKRTDTPGVVEIPNDAHRGPWARRWVGVERLLARALGRRLTGTRPERWLCWVGQPHRSLLYARGFEDFDFPATRQITHLAPRLPDVIHAHNLHGGYFDLEELPRLSNTFPTFITLHDAWLLSGHCAHSLECERWITGCGSCPHLDLYPRAVRDNTAMNWERKREIYRRSRLYVTTPSRWLMDKVDRSILAEGIVEQRVIPNGVDVDLFRPGNRNEARRAVGLPEDADVVLFAANGIAANPWKDWPTVRAAVERTAGFPREKPLIFVGLGDARAPERAGAAELRFVPFAFDKKQVVDFYRAADVYLHCARAETFPLTILEALACGIPVIGSAVGGIPEQVDDARAAGADKSTGLLTDVGAVGEVADALETLLSNDELRLRLAQNARRVAVDRFDLQRQTGEYLAWYEEVLGSPAEAAAAQQETRAPMPRRG